MNTPTTPLLPQGTFLEPKNKGRARVRVAVFVVLAVHCIGLLALLMQGCKKDNQAGTGSASDVTNAPPTTPVAAFEPTNMPPAVTNMASAPSTTLAPTPPPEAPAEYTIAAGDSFSSVAKKFHVTTKALVDANPGVEPTRLQIGQKIHIPPAAPTAITGNSAAMPATDAASGDAIYTVKSGDTLTGIAQSHHVTVRSLRAENDLKTDSIKVGQKLKIPKATMPASAPDSGATVTSAPPTSPSGR